MQNFDYDYLQSQRIIQLRTQLAKMHAKLSKYDQMNHRLTQLQGQISHLLQIYNVRQEILGQICDCLGIKMGQNKISNGGSGGEPISKSNMSLVETVNRTVVKCGQLVVGVNREEDVLKSISKTMKETAQQFRQAKEAYRELEKEHIGCANKIGASKQSIEKIKVLQAENKEKDRELKQLRMALEEGQGRIRVLEGEAEERGRALIGAQERAAEGAASQAERQAVLDRCGALLQTLQVGAEQYLTHYFRSNGVPLQAPKPYKNKYNMVFD